MFFAKIECGCGFLVLMRLYQVAPTREQLGITAMRKQCPQVFENSGFARVCKNICASRLIPIKRNLVLGSGNSAFAWMQLFVAELLYYCDQGSIIKMVWHY